MITLPMATNSKIIECLLAGESPKVVAKATGTCLQTIYQRANALANCGLMQKLIPGRKKGQLQPQNQEHIVRAQDIIKFRKQGSTYQEIADKYGISRERIRQIIKKNDISLTGYRAHEQLFCSNCQSLASTLNQKAMIKRTTYCINCNKLICQIRSSQEHMINFNERNNKIRELLAKGHTYTHIGRCLGYHNQPYVRVHSNIKHWNNFEKRLVKNKAEFAARKDLYLSKQTGESQCRQ